MTATIIRRLTQTAVALVLAGATVLVTQWANPAGHLVVHLGRPFYSRSVAQDTPYVTIDITLKNVGLDPVRIDRENFMLIDTTGQTYRSDPATHFLLNHFDVVWLPAGTEIKGATVFKITPGRQAAEMVFVTPTDQVVRFRLP